MGLSRVAQPSNTIHVVMARANVCWRVGGRRVSTELRNETSTPPSSPAPEVVHKGGYHYFIHAPAPTLLGPSVVSEYLPQTHTTKALTNTHTHMQIMHTHKAYRQRANCSYSDFAFNHFYQKKVSEYAASVLPNKDGSISYLNTEY